MGIFAAFLFAQSRGVDRGCVTRTLSETGSGYLASAMISWAEEEEVEDGRKEKEEYRRQGHMH